MAVRNTEREWGSIERVRTPSQRGRMAHQQARPTWPSIPRQEHMNNDALILLFNFEP
jgi:hypothetical protein